MGAIGLLLDGPGLGIGFWLLARGGGSSWRLQIGHLPAGRYEVRVRAIAPGGRAEPPRSRALRVRA